MDFLNERLKTDIAFYKAHENSSYQTNDHKFTQIQFRLVTYKLYLAVEASIEVRQQPENPEISVYRLC